MAQALKAPAEQVRAGIFGGAVVHMDETPMLREGVAGNWAGAASTPRRVMLQALQALQALQVLQMLQMLQALQALQMLPLRARCVFTGLMGDKPAALIISDRHAAHSRLQPEQRQVCRARLLRDFQRMAQRRDQAGRVGRWLGLGGRVKQAESAMTRGAPGEVSATARASSVNAHHPPVTRWRP